MGAREGEVNPWLSIHKDIYVCGWANTEMCGDTDPSVYLLVDVWVYENRCSYAWMLACMSLRMFGCTAKWKYGLCVGVHL